MTAAPDARSLEAIGRARAAVSRIRIRRALSDRQRREARLDFALALIVAAGVIGLFVLGVVALGELTGLGYTALVKRSMLFTAVVIVVAMSAGLITFILGMFAALGVVYGVLGAPVWIVKSIRTTLAHRRRRTLEDTLAACGEIVVPADTRNVTRLLASKAALRELGTADAALEYVSSDNAVRVRDLGPPEACPRCHAGLAHPSPGVRHCQHCGFERYDELPSRSDELVKARAAIDKILDGQAANGDRRALWAAFKARRRIDDLPTMLAMGAAAFAFACIGELTMWAGIGWLTNVVRVLVFICGFTAGIFAPMVVYRAYSRRFREFKPGVAAYDQAIAVDVIGVLAQQGVMTTDALASYLGITRVHLEHVLASLERLGIAPAYHDTARDRLISLHAGSIDDAACPACGGQLEPGPNATLRCAHCGG